MSVTFRDESNEPSFIMIGYSDATVTVLNYPLIVRSNASLDRALLQYHSCGGNFVIRLYLIPLISGQCTKKFDENFFLQQTKHGLIHISLCVHTKALFGLTKIGLSLARCLIIC